LNESFSIQKAKATIEAGRDIAGVISVMDAGDFELELAFDVDHEDGGGDGEELRFGGVGAAANEGDAGAIGPLQGFSAVGLWGLCGRRPGLYYDALSGRKEESPVTWHHAVGVAREQSWARCPCHKTSRGFSCSAAGIRKEIGESKAKDPAATEIRRHDSAGLTCSPEKG